MSEAVQAAATARGCVWSPRELDHPNGDLCKREGACLDRTREEIIAVLPHLTAGLAELIAQHEEVYDFEVSRMMCSCGDPYTEGLMSEHLSSVIAEELQRRVEG